MKWFSRISIIKAASKKTTFADRDKSDTKSVFWMYTKINRILSYFKLEKFQVFPLALNIHRQILGLLILQK